MPSLFCFFASLPRPFGFATATGAFDDESFLAAGARRVSCNRPTALTVLARRTLVFVALTLLLASGTMALAAAAPAKVLTQAKAALKAGDYAGVVNLLQKYDDGDSWFVMGQALRISG